VNHARTALAAIAIAAGALAWPAGSAATGESTAASSPPAGRAAVVTANAQVRQELDELAVAPDGGTIEVVPVGAALTGLLEDEGFLGNVHILQDHLNNHDARVLNGADVAITDLVAIDVRPGGDVVVFTR
jgi:hypothetical protein